MRHNAPTDDVVFSLTCADCDAGGELITLEAALAAGWAQITYAPDISMANHVGLCPVCQWEREAEGSSDD